MPFAIIPLHSVYLNSGCVINSALTKPSYPSSPYLVPFMLANVSNVLSLSAHVLPPSLFTTFTRSVCLLSVYCMSHQTFFPAPIVSAVPTHFSPLLRLGHLRLCDLPVTSEAFNSELPSPCPPTACHSTRLLPRLLSLSVPSLFLPFTSSLSFSSLLLAFLYLSLCLPLTLLFHSFPSLLLSHSLSLSPFIFPYSHFPVVSSLIFRLLLYPSASPS